MLKHTNNQQKIYPNWDIVLKAIILFKSFCNNPQVAAKKAVLDPIKVINNKTLPLNSKIGEILINWVEQNWCNTVFRAV